MKRNKGFSVKKVKDGIYELARIYFCAKEKYSNEMKWTGFVEYQKKPSEQKYYGGHIKLHGNDLHALNYMNKIMKDINKNVKMWKSDIVKVLEYVKNNYQRYIYDEREYEIIKITEVKPLEHNRYMVKDDKNCCILSCIAKNKKQAIKKIKKKIGKIIHEGDTWGYDEEFLIEWLKNPEVILDNYNKAPKIKGIYEELEIKQDEKKEKAG